MALESIVIAIWGDNYSGCQNVVTRDHYIRALPDCEINGWAPSLWEDAFKAESVFACDVLSFVTSSKCPLFMAEHLIAACFLACYRS